VTLVVLQSTQRNTKSQTCSHAIVCQLAKTPSQTVYHRDFSQGICMEPTDALVKLRTPDNANTNMKCQSSRLRRQTILPFLLEVSQQLEFFKKSLLEWLLERKYFAREDGSSRLRSWTFTIPIKERIAMGS
jgi:hypothetical protein